MSVDKSPTKAAVSVSEMSKMCDLSRSRFYSLIDQGIFPSPVQNESVKRPYYDRELQEKCLAIRRTGVGNNGQPILFNCKPRPRKVTAAKPSSKTTDNQYTELLDAVRALGMNATASAIAEAVAASFPNGIEGIDQGEIVRAVFLYLQQKS